MDELKRLCAERELVTREIHFGNSYYGNAAVLKRFAGLPPPRPLKAAIEHSLLLIDDFWASDLRAQIPTFLCASAARAREFEERTRDGRVAVAIGPLVEYAKPARRPRSGRRLLAFPAHSTHHIEANYDSERFARWLEGAATDFDAVTVCVYWREVQRGMYEAYRNRGFECVTAGHVYDDGFLPRLRAYLDEADAIATNEVGSHLLYAAGRGLPVALVRQDVDYAYESEEIAKRDGFTERQSSAYRRLWTLFSAEIEPPSREAADWIREVLGVAHLRSPEELKRILQEAEERYARAVPFGRRLKHRLKAAARRMRAELRNHRRRT